MQDRPQRQLKFLRGALSEDIKVELTSSDTHIDTLLEVRIAELHPHLLYVPYDDY
jgi:hypothetical protein